MGWTSGFSGVHVVIFENNFHRVRPSLFFWSHSYRFLFKHYLRSSRVFHSYHMNKPLHFKFFYPFIDGIHISSSFEGYPSQELNFCSSKSLNWSRVLQVGKVTMNSKQYKKIIKCFISIFLNKYLELIYYTFFRTMIQYVAMNQNWSSKFKKFRNSQSVEYFLTV